MMVRKATMVDLPTILAIERLVFPSPWTDDHFRYELEKNPYAVVKVAVEQDHVLGYIDFWITFQVGQINNLAVNPAVQRKGIGKTLLLDALAVMADAGCERVTLEVRVSNQRAQQLYAAAGFQKILTKPSYYADGEAAYLMEKTL